MFGASVNIFRGTWKIVLIYLMYIFVDNPVHCLVVREI
jgi:hypothetical protein